MSNAAKAVFLSYASQDAEAARRIRDALCAAGVDVWFDQSALRGGEAWDASIRMQIKECALFVPVISANTQAREEGYFRLEWRLAVDRSHLMADDKTFMLPVVIDDTAGSGARVPDAFHARQWTQLPDGETPAKFCEDVKQLLSVSTAQETVSRGQLEPIPINHISTAAKVGASAITPPVQPKTARRLATGAVVTAIAVVGASWWLWPHRPVTTTDPKVDTKSIAVIPFTNMSDDKDNNLFFADGMHEDILTNLALIRELKVVSRTSVMQYRATTKTIRQIGQELGVAYLLEGSVRRAGNKVRVTGQLINARTDEHIWAKSYDRDLTDIFAIQAALAKEIAGSLQAALSPQEITFIERRPTENMAAYDLLLQARTLRYDGSNNLVSVEKQVGLLEKAVALDPQFAAAWGELSVRHAQNVFFGGDTSDARLAKAKAASDNSVRLAPDSPDVILTLGDYYYYGYRDYAQAQTQYEKLVRLKPNDPTGYQAIGLIQRRQNRWADSLANLQKAAQLEPGNIGYIGNVVSNLMQGRRFDEAITEQRRIVALLPPDFGETMTLYTLAFQKNGSTREWQERLGTMSAEKLETRPIREVRKLLAEITGDLAEFRRLDRLVPYANDYNFGREPNEQALTAATIYAAGGDWVAARSRLENYPKEFRARLVLEPSNAYLWSQLGMMEAILGHKEDALRFARKAVELLPESRDAFRGPELGEHLAFVYAWTGDKDRAIAELTRLLRVPGFGLNVHYLRRGAWSAPLRGDPRFEALLKDQKNNAPLF